MDIPKKSGSEELLTERDYLKSLDIKIVILSRGRYNSITTTNLLPDWIEVVVPKSEEEYYRRAIPNPIITTDDNVVGLGMLRNWCLDNFEEETVIMVDDDITLFYCITNEHARRIEDKEELIQIFINTAVMANDAGAKVFGYFQTDIRKYNGCEPFGLCTWVGTIIGVIGRKYRFRNDKYKVDIDYCLQNLLVERIMWSDNQYFAINKKDLNVGGNATFRTENDFNKSVQTLKQRWGNCLKISDGFKTQIKIRFNFNRRQKLSYE